MRTSSPIVPVVNGCAASSSRPRVKSKPSCSATSDRSAAARRARTRRTAPPPGPARRRRARSRSTSGSSPLRRSRNRGSIAAGGHARLVLLEQHVVGRAGGVDGRSHPPLRVDDALEKRRQDGKVADATRLDPHAAGLRVEFGALAHERGVEPPFTAEAPCGFPHVDLLVRLELGVALCQVVHQREEARVGLPLVHQRGKRADLARATLQRPRRHECLLVPLHEPQRRGEIGVVAQLDDESVV